MAVSSICDDDCYQSRGGRARLRITGRLVRTELAKVTLMLAKKLVDDGAIEVLERSN